MHRRHTIKRLHRFSHSLHEHLAIIEAIARRDAELAETLAKQHVRSLHDDFMKALQADTAA